MRPSDRKHWRGLLRWMRRRFPVPEGDRLVVRLRRQSYFVKAHGTEHDGDYHYYQAERLHVIGVARGLSYEAARDALWHEWAHLWRMQLPDLGQGEHDAIFGAIRAEIERAWLASQYATEGAQS